MSNWFARLAAVAVVAGAAFVSDIAWAQKAAGSDTLVGAWRGRVQFTSGPFAGTKDLEFMYAFAAGGTMTESSNYDAMPPVTPAYGIWRKVGVRKYEARYSYYPMRAVNSAEELVRSGGWAPDGLGTLTQSITLSVDGNAFESVIHFELFDRNGKAVPGGGEAKAAGSRLRF